MWFIGVEVEQETSTPPPKKILDPPLQRDNFGSGIITLDPEWCSRPSLCRLLPFHLVLRRCFKAMALVGI